MQTRLLSMVALVALLFAVPAVFFVRKYQQSFYIYFPLVAVQHFIGLSVKCFWMTWRLFKDILRAPEKMQLHSVCRHCRRSSCSHCFRKASVFGCRILEHVRSRKRRFKKKPNSRSGIQIGKLFQKKTKGTSLAS